MTSTNLINAASVSAGAATAVTKHTTATGAYRFSLEVSATFGVSALRNRLTVYYVDSSVSLTSPTVADVTAAFGGSIKSIEVESNDTAAYERACCLLQGSIFYCWAECGGVAATVTAKLNEFTEAQPA